MSLEFSGLTYDRQAARYRGPTGRLVSSEDVRVAIDADIDKRKSRLDEHASGVAAAADNLSKGTGTRLDYENSVADWFEAMSEEAKALHLAHTAAAKGGFHNVDDDDFILVALLIMAQYRALRRRRRILLDNPRYGASATFVRHCEAYAEAGRSTYETVAETEDRRVGNVYTYNLPAPFAAHCHGRKSCIAMTMKGVVHIDEMLRVGSRICGPWCRCKTPRFETRQEAEESWKQAGLESIVKALRAVLRVSM